MHNFDYRTAMKRAIIDYILLDYSERVRVNVLEIPTRFKPSVIRAPVPWRNNYLISKQFCRHNLFTTHSIVQRVSHTQLIVTTYHSSEIRSLCLMKCPSEMLQNLTYFIYTKTQNCL